MYQQPNLIQTQQAKNAFLPKLQQYRAVGPIEDYKYDALKPKKQMKEIRKVLLPEKKKILFLKYGHKFNFKDRCVVCGTHQIWESSDYLRPPIPLDKVEKGRPLRGTYCQKHAAIHKQMEMLQQQILADEHGLDFKAFIPKAKMPSMLRKQQLNTLTKEDVMRLIGMGWDITPPTPATDAETQMAEIVRLIVEIQLNTERVNYLIKGEQGE
jgi:hypothetical protein